MLKRVQHDKIFYCIKAVCHSELGSEYDRGKRKDFEHFKQTLRKVHYKMELNYRALET